MGTGNPSSENACVPFSEIPATERGNDGSRRHAGREVASVVCREIGWSVPAALLVHRQLCGHAMLRRLVVLDQDLAQCIFGRARELFLARIAAHLDGTCVGGDAPKRVACCASCELLVEAIAESCHGDHTFGWLPRAA